MQSGNEGYTASALMDLEEAPGAELIPALEALLQEGFAARRTQVWLVDYRLSVLQTVTGAGPNSTPAGAVPVDGSTVGRTFASQQPSVLSAPAGHEVQVPISVRSDRLGVLAVTFSGEPSDDLVRSLSGVARALGHAITVANRHTDVFERAARTQRLSLAAELQWQILPGRGCCGPDFDLAGQLEPAYHVAGDAFDWNVAPGHLTVCVLEGMGRGTRAAQATNLAVTALRNARRADLGLADQARMAAEAVYGQYGGELWIEASLLRFDRAERGLTIVNAGSPKIFRQQDDAINELVLDEELPLGRFDGADYRAQSIQLAAGDRIIVVSDGVHQAGPSDDRQFGEVRLGAVLRATRHLSPAETVRQVIRELRAHHLDGEIDDDAVAVVVDLKHPGD